MNFRLKDHDRRVAETLAHASNLMVVNGESPQLNIIRTEAHLRRKRFELWSKELLQGFESQMNKLKTV